MKILHTSDWHLGHTLHEHSREHEHLVFLDWLLDTLKAEQIEAMIISGDIFDSANPSAQSQKIWYGFLAAANRLMPDLEIIAIGGNHDSAARLSAPAPLLESMRIHVTGGLPYLEQGGIDWERLIFPLRNRDGSVEAFVIAVPFLRPADLPPGPADIEDAVIDGVRRRYAEAVNAARLLRREGQALITTGHCYLSGTALSELSERKILGGNQHALPVEIFDKDITYMALGHLHLAQTVGGFEHIRYSGSPLPLSVSEIHYTHQVCLVNIEQGRCISVKSLPVPRPVEFVRIPSTGLIPIDSLLLRIAALPDAGNTSEQQVWPYLEVAPLIDKPVPGLREEILKAVSGKAVRLVRIVPAPTSPSMPLNLTGAGLEDITPEEVFIRCYQSRFNEQPPAEYSTAFNELLQQVEQGDTHQ